MQNRKLEDLSPSWLRKALQLAIAQGRFSRAAEYVGDTTLAQSLWKLANSRGLVVHVDVLPPEGSVHADRRALSERLRGLIAERLAV